MNAPTDAALLTPPTDHAAIALPRIVRLSQLAPSPTNPRRTFRDESLQEMAISIERHGVLQAILARPWPAAMPKPHPDVRLEIVAGERRYRASILAGVDTIPATVRALSDTEVLEIQILENLQREEVHPLEEAEGYQVLMLRTNYSADQLAEKVGKSKAYIYARLKLCAITGEAREAFMAGTLSASVALLIARIPVPAIQAKAAKEVLNGHYGNSEPMSARMATQHIQQRYMLRLADAPFPRGDAKLLEDAPTCAKCPKRSGNAPELYPDVKSADVCTDPDCFAAKKDAHKQRQIAVAESKGMQVITGKAAEEIAQYGIHDYNQLNGGWVQLIKIVYNAPKTAKGKLPTWRDLVGPEFQAGAMIESHQTGILFECAQEKDLIDAAKANGVEIAAAPGRSGGSGSDTDREREKKARAETAYRAALLDRILFAHNGEPLETEDLREVAFALWQRLGSEGQKHLCRALTGTNTREDIQTLNDSIPDMAWNALNRLLLASALIGHVHVSGWHEIKPPERMLAAADRWGVDAQVVRKQSEPPAKPGKPMPYRHPHKGMTWSGRGKKPAWVEEWISAGNALEELKVAA